MPQARSMRRSFREKDMDDLQNNDILGRILPEFTFYSKQYGVPYFFWWTHEPKLMVANPEHARELLSKQVSSLENSPVSRHLLTYFFGYGLASVDGEDWVLHRRVVSPAFRLEKLKAMTQVMEKCIAKMLDEWQQQVEQGTLEMEAGSHFSKLTADIIAHTAFGSSYDKGQLFFQLLDTLGALQIKTLDFDWVPFSRLVPTKQNRTIWKLQTDIDNLLLGLIQERRNSVKYGEAANFGEDLLGLMITESENNKSFDDVSLIGECRTFYFAGNDTTASLIKWATYLLAVNPEWQSRARQEVLWVCTNKESWNAEMLNRLKLVGMIIYETLRLYPGGTLITRNCTKDISIGSITIPAGTSIDIPVIAIHHDKELWGDDVHEFKPERFSNGTSRASKHPNAFMAFSLGPRICVGQAFALMEAKLVISMLLQRFSVGISSRYRHCPVCNFTVQPCHGLQITLEKL